MNNGGEITVTLTLDSKQFYAASKAADAAGDALGDSLDRKTKAATDRTAARFEAFGGVVKSTLIGAGIAAGVAGVASVKMAGDFEQSLAVLASVSGATGAEMAKLSEKARELGQDASLPGVSARDAAQAMSELAKAGVGVNDILGASKGVLSLAKAGNLDVADAATVAARALNAFGLSGDKAGQVADILAAGANSSSADVTDMAMALSQAGSSASRMGVSLGDTVTALGLFSNAGINGSDAGTSLKTALQRLAAPTDEARKAMKELGVNFFDAQGNFIGLQATAGQLQKQLGSLTQEQREQALAAIFGSDASRAAGVLAAEGAAGFEKMSAAVNKQGAATDLAAAQNSGFKGALDNLLSTLETIGTDLGTKVLPPLTKFLQMLAEKLPPVIDFLIAHGQTIITVLGAMAAAFAAMRVAGFISDLTKATKTLELFVGAKNATGLKALGTAFKFMGGIAMTVIRGVGAAILANPIFAAIAAIIAILVFLQVKFDIFGKAFRALMPVFQAVGDFFISVWKSISSAFMTGINAVVGFWNSTLLPIFTTIGTILAAVGQVFFKIFAFIALIVVGTLTIIFTIIFNILSAIWGVVSSILGAIGNFFAAIFSAIWAAISWYVNLWLTIITTVLGAIWNVITTIWNAIYGFLAPIITNIFNFIKGVFNSVLSFLTGIWNSVYGTISGAVGRIWSAITGTFNNVVNFVGGIGGKILGALGSFGSLLYNSGRDMINGLINGAKSLLGNIGKFFLDVVPGWIRDPFAKALGIHSPSRVFADYGKNIVQGLTDGISANADMAIRAAATLGNTVAGIQTGLGDSNISVGADGTDIAGGSAGAPIQQTNNIYNQVDLMAVNRELAWQVRR